MSASVAPRVVAAMHAPDESTLHSLGPIVRSGAWVTARVEIASAR